MTGPQEQNAWYSVEIKARLITQGVHVSNTDESSINGLKWVNGWQCTPGGSSESLYGLAGYISFPGNNSS